MYSLPDWPSASSREDVGADLAPQNNMTSLRDGDPNVGCIAHHSPNRHSPFALCGCWAGGWLGGEIAR